MEKSWKEKDPDTRRSWKSLLPILSVKLLFISLLFLAAIFSFAVLAHEVVFENEKSFDEAVFRFIAGYSPPGIINLMETLTFFGSSAFLFPAYVLIIIFLLFKGQKRLSINIAIIALSSTGILHLLKRIFRRERPELPLISSLNTYSFPSGHAVSSFIFCMMIVHVVWQSQLNKTLKWISALLLLIFALSVGLSRIFLKMHYASDVLAGFCLGLVWVILAFWLMKRVEDKEQALKQAGH